MKKTAPKIWMNLTTSANWKRPPVGIVRVEISIRDELKKIYGDKFHGCLWDGRSFVEYDYEVSKAIRRKTCEDGTIADNQMEKTSDLPPIYPVLPKMQAIRSVVQGIFSLLPTRLRSFFNRFLYKLRPYVINKLKYGLINKIYRLINRDTSNPLARSSGYDLNFADFNSHPFQDGDILVSIGLDWDYTFYKSFYYLKKHSGIRIITCCYDLIPVLFPQYCVGNVSNIFKSYFIEIADGSDEVICISKQSQRDLIEMLSNSGGALVKTSVFPLGDNVPLENSTVSGMVDHLVNEPFILFVSTIERRKNHEVIYRAYHSLCKSGYKAILPKLVFVGMQGWGVQDLMSDISLDPEVDGMVIMLNHVSDTELAWLYRAAMFCVFPSLYEGWGLPVGEALSFGKAVIASDRGSLPEVGGDLVVYLDPWDVSAWADTLLKLSQDDSYRNQLEQRIRKEYQPREWSLAGRAVAQVIDNLIYKQN